MDLTTFIGISASVFTGVSLLPQLIKVLREKTAKGMSFSMLLVLLTGLCLWVIYGLRINNWILVAANGFSALLNVMILSAGIWYSVRK
ncbi:MAG: SemiSWEET family transporter [Bacteroidota bacterium]